MPEAALGRRMGRYVSLSDAERRVLADLEVQPRLVPRGAAVRRERDGAALWVVRGGWAAASLVMPDGGRQITRVHLAGDVLDVTDPAGAHIAGTLTALTDLDIAAIPRTALAALFVDHPRLAALLFQLVRVERMSMCDRVAAIGRTDARARLAGLLLDLLGRQREAGTAPAGAWTLPLTQEEIGDTIGLTAVHVNRMMRNLVEGGLIRRTGNMIELVDEAALKRLSGYVDRWLRIETDWLPEAR